jgi:hypothetical protein
VDILAVRPAVPRAGALAVRPVDEVVVAVRKLVVVVHIPNLSPRYISGYLFINFIPKNEN